jgi:hypothetical protein
MKLWLVILTVVTMMALAGCGGETPAATVEEDVVTVKVSEDESGAYLSAVLDTSYEGALPASSQLSLGSLLLEETENAITPAQAAGLLPLWQAIQSGVLQSNTEINAVLKQIEGKMTAEQLAAIAAMQLTAQDMQTWAQEQGMNMVFSPEAMATRQAEGGNQGGFGPPGNLSEEERAAIRATMEAGGMPFGGDRGNLSEEERAAMRATAEASGTGFGNRGFRGGAGQFDFFVEPLIELLTRRVAE